MTKNKYFSSSRKKTPWDDGTVTSCLSTSFKKNGKTKKQYTKV